MLSWLLLQIFSPLVGVLLTTWGAGIACLVVGFLAPAWLPFNRMNLLWTGVVLMCFGVVYGSAFKSGERHMAQLIAAKDNAAIERVQRATKRVEECGPENWDVTRGSCSK